MNSAQSAIIIFLVFIIFNKHVVLQLHIPTTSAIEIRKYFCYFGLGSRMQNSFLCNFFLRLVDFTASTLARPSSLQCIVRASHSLQFRDFAGSCYRLGINEMISVTLALSLINVAASSMTPHPLLLHCRSRHHLTSEVVVVAFN